MSEDRIKMFKRNANGNILQWSIGKISDTEISIKHGLYNMKETTEVIKISKKKVNEIESRVQEKYKQGYKQLTDLYDNAPDKISNGADEIAYLRAYLPKYNTTKEGFILPMLAKTLENNTPFDKFGSMLGQWKINGLRCIVGAKKANDLFGNISFTYHSREGVDWTENMSWFDKVLIHCIDGDLVELMVEEGVCLDGELYLPGYSVNEIDSFVKNNKIQQHYLLQYWIYDLCMPDTNALSRTLKLDDNIDAKLELNDKITHISNAAQVVLLPTYMIHNVVEAIEYRDKFIELGFEGLILRNPWAEYAFGKRNSSMFKYKKKQDGWFEVVDIREDKRGLPIYILRNDINDELFDCTINTTQIVQKTHLNIKDQLIGKKGLVEYRERSGVKNVPFHAKLIKIFV